MSYERWTKRMDDAVESTWLRSLRSVPTGKTGHRFVPTPGAAKKQVAALRSRTIAAGADR
jgi:hypothetical protein